jgi:hypothetical protein
MSNTYLIHVDTASSQTVTGAQTYSGGGGSSNLFSIQGQPSVNKVNGNPFQCSIILGNRHRRIRSISLKNAQVPIGFYNVRAPYNTFKIGSTPYTVTPGSYSTTATLVTALNAATPSPLSSVGAFSYDTSLSLFKFTPTNGATIRVTPLSLLSFLGFTDGQTATGTTVITATNPSIINFDTYINIWIENLGQSSLEPNQITFKIPITYSSGGIVQWTEFNQFTQKVLVTDRGVRLDRLNVTVLDRFGNILNNNGLDWSFSLEIEADT